MTKIVVPKTIDVKKDIYQPIQKVNYVRDSTTGELFLKSGINQRSVIPEQFKTATFITGTNSVSNSTATIYQVPFGKIFFLISITNQISYNANTYGNSAFLKINSSVIMRGYGAATAGAYVLGQNLNAIIILVGGDTITATTQSTDVTSTATIFGYLIEGSEYYPALA